ncbi:MAG: RnfH family protein [Pseudohongiellaceae bacterium]|nr:RnfH family protein [Pseudohongiellaceae bacterium]
MNEPARISVEVAYALPDRQEIIALEVEQGVTALEAVERSGIQAKFEQIDLATDSMGIFSRRLDGKSSPLPQDYVLKAGDRVEIYRPLQIDPMQSRLLRAARSTKVKKKPAQPARFKR